MAQARRRLGVWLEDLHVAEIEQRGVFDLRLRYTPEALERWPANSPIVSCSLPLGRRPLPALPFCAGLLPEGRALQELAHRAGVATNDTFGLLARYGRDVAGALIISAEEPEPRRHGVAPFDERSLADAVDALDEHPLGVDDESELSLAGLQDKLLLVRTPDGQWGRPLHGRPSTHILKRDDARFPGLVAAEGACLRLAAALGLTSVDVELAEIGEHRCLIVSRFDRAGSGADVTRLHQEDLCQAMGVNPAHARGRIKYEDAGGPSLRDLAALLDRHARDGAGELDALVRAVTFTVLIGNADAHGKNIALLHDTPETITLAPLYDTVPTALWPKLRTRAAMTVRGRDRLADVTVDDIVAEAASWPHPQARARETALDLAGEAAEAVADGVVDEVPALAALVSSRARSLLSG